MKKFLSRIVILFFICFLYSCSNGINDSGSNHNPNNPTNNNPKISSEYWGTWIQMDTGNEFYIDSQNVYKFNSSTSKTKLQSGIDGYSLESDEVLKKGTTVFFRKGGKKRGFSATFSGFSANGNRSARAAGTGSQGITGRRTNKENEDDTETVDSDDGNSVDFEGGVADDPQTVTITDGENTGEVTVTPGYDGENIGSVPVVEPGKYAFKTTYTIKNAETQGIMYGNNLGVYNISFNITNIGEETCATSVYSISWTDSNLSSTDLPQEGNFTSIGPGSAKVITGSFIYGYFNEEYKDVTITISITDSKYGKTWNDYVTLRFYRGWVNFKINARNFNESSRATLNGFIVYPDGRSRRFTVSSNNTTIIDIPWSSKDYYFVLSGANNDTEMCYSFIASEYGNPADLSGVWSISDINSYEPNDSIQSAISITNYSTPIKAYLKNGDIDYYKINTNALKCSKGALEFSDMYFIDYITLDENNYNNNDSAINPGESIWMDVMIHNSNGKTESGITVETSSESPFITFSSSSANYGDVNGKYYQTYYGYNLTRYKNIGFSSYTNAMNYYETGSYVVSDRYPFKFTISASCPIGTIIPITLKMKDNNGYEWTDSFTITVVKSVIDMKYSGNNFNDNTNISDSNNKDGCINPGETIWMDIKLQNKGTSQANGIKLEMTSNSEYITFSSKNANYGNIKAGNYQTYYGSKVSAYSNQGWAAVNSEYYSVTSENYVPFKFTISNECPINTIIPINIKITDNNNYEWNESFNISVIKPDVTIIYSGNKISDSTTISNTYNNKDGTINPGETIWMDLKIQNKGSSQAKSITLEANCDSEYLTFISNTANYGNINAGNYQTYYGSKVSAYSNQGWAAVNSEYYSVTSENYIPLKFTITDTCPINSIIPINLKFTDINGYEWNDTFNITIEDN